MRRPPDRLRGAVLVAGAPGDVRAQPGLRVGDPGERRHRPRQAQLHQHGRRAARILRVRDKPRITFRDHVHMTSEKGLVLKPPLSEFWIAP